MSGLGRFFLSTLLPPQAAELAEYNSKLVELEEAKRIKEQEADEWQNKVRSQQRSEVPGITPLTIRLSSFSASFFTLVFVQINIHVQSELNIISIFISLLAIIRY